MSLRDDQAQFAEIKPRLQQLELNQLKSRLDTVKLERTIAALHQIPTLPETRASEAEATLRRMYARAKRWED